MYLILAADDPDDLMTMVNAHLGRGWELVGGLTFGRTAGGGERYAQAMTKEGE